ncbi:MAG: hypothetical protein Q9160_009328 [Pyrenula sp. 1 TL-2023]
MSRSFTRSSIIFCLIAPILGSSASSQKPLRHGEVAVGVCASSPLHLVDHSSCPPQHHVQHPQGAKIGFWDGPHACAGAYCVYSNGEFANGRGIVFLSTAEDAQIAASSLIAKNKQIAPEQQSTGTYPPFHITEVPGKGLGVVANQTILKGTRLMAEMPAMVLHHSFIDDVPGDERLALLDKAAEALSPPLRQLFMNQHGHFGGHKVFDILYTNSFQMALGTSSRDHLANFPEVSRFNHDCRPNVVFHLDSLTHYTFAARDIYPGTQLTISYLDEFRVRSVRKSRALRSWGFSCDCHQCTIPDNLSDESDQRLLRIWEIEQELSDVASGAPLSNGKETIENLMRLYKKERLQHRMADAFTLAALNYNGLGLKGEAMRYGKQSIEANLMENGPNAPDVAAMRGLMADLEGHWSWMKRIVPGATTATTTNLTGEGSGGKRKANDEETTLPESRLSTPSQDYRPLESVEAMCTWLLNL